ncbi:immunity protein Tsi6 family protein [Pseudomonas aeruginosa]|nr:immunity protein Tsi6 family protein [Pseudomonas aeruginosa]
MSPVNYVERALALVAERLARHPQCGMLLSVEKQLLYLKAVLLDRSLDRSALHRLSFGGIAGKSSRRPTRNSPGPSRTHSTSAYALAAA